MLSKNEKILSCSKLPEMARKVVKHDFDIFRSPPENNLGGVHKMFVKNEKNKSSSKLPEMARKLVENEFWTV